MGLAIVPCGQRGHDRREKEVLREGTESDVRYYVDAEQLLDLWDELVLPPAVREAWADRIARLRDE